VRSAIRKHVKDFAAVVVLFVIGIGVGGYILSQQRLYLPGWVPLVGQDFFTLKGEFTTAQAVTPGQGQTVDVAGVKVGEISNVELKNGRAVVTMKILPKYGAVYRDASMLLRPKTGLKDMIIELSPGNPTSGKLKSGGTVPIQNTLPDINPDEILASLDGDTRAYLRLLLAGGAQGLRNNQAQLAAVFKRFEPTARDVAKITTLLSQRQANLRRVIHNFQLLSTELSTRDASISAFVVSNNAVFQHLANQDANLQATLQLLPPTLVQANSALAKTGRLANALGPSLQALRPAARALGPALVQVRPFLKKTTPIIQNQLRPFTVASIPTIRKLKPAARDLAALTPNLVTTFKVLNYAVNELAYNPPGSRDEGFLFWAAWANHLGASVFATQDAQGPIRHGLVEITCSASQVLQQVILANPQLSTITQLANLPPPSSICPKSQ
jgi:phospholipid/cholesterol/gamma-HCH transport system substrate-binding protein